MQVYNVLIFSLFDMLMLVIISRFLLQNQVSNFKRDLKFVITGSILIAVNDYFITSEILSHILIFPIDILLLKRYVSRFKIDIFKTLLLYSIIFEVMFIAQTVCVIGLSLLYTDFAVGLQFGFVSQILSLILVIAFCKKVDLSVFYNYVERENTIMKFVILSVYVLYYTLTVLWYLSLENMMDYVIAILVILAITLLTNTIVLANSKIHKEIKRKLELYEVYFPIIDDIVDEIKARQHDYHNHIQAISGIKNKLACEVTTEVEEYASQLIERDVWATLVKMDNKILMAFLYSKYKHAEDIGIDMKIVVDSFFTQSRYKNYELVEIYGILIDNAIEAALETKERRVVIITGSENNRNTLEVINSANNIQTHHLQRIFDFAYSSKSGEGRGIGLFKLKKLIDREKGTIMVDYDAQISKMSIKLLFS